jgi:hypothetical protein
VRGAVVPCCCRRSSPCAHGVLLRCCPIPCPLVVPWARACTKLGGSELYCCCSNPCKHEALLRCCSSPCTHVAFLRCCSNPCPHVALLRCCSNPCTHGARAHNQVLGACARRHSHPRGCQWSLRRPPPLLAPVPWGACWSGWLLCAGAVLGAAHRGSSHSFRVGAPPPALCGWGGRLAYCLLSPPARAGQWRCRARARGFPALVCGGLDFPCHLGALPLLPAPVPLGGAGLPSCCALLALSLLALSLLLSGLPSLVPLLLSDWPSAACLGLPGGTGAAQPLCPACSVPSALPRGRCSVSYFQLPISGWLPLVACCP